MTSWIITGLLAVLIAWIVLVEIRFGRRSKAFITSTNKEIDALTKNATIAYRKRFGRDPTAPFVRVEDPKKP